MLQNPTEGLHSPSHAALQPADQNGDVRSRSVGELGLHLGMDRFDLFLDRLAGTVVEPRGF